MSKIVRNIPDGLEASYADIKLDTIADLVNLTGTPPDIVWVSGYHTKGDGSYGSHIFEWDPNSTEPHNGGTIIELGATFPADWSDQTQLDTWFNYSGGTTGRYKLKFDSAVNVKWFGAKGDSSECYKEVLQLYNYCISNNYKSLFFPNGNYYISNTLHISSYISIIGDNANIFSSIDKGAVFHVFHDNSGNPSVPYYTNTTIRKEAYQPNKIQGFNFIYPSRNLWLANNFDYNLSSTAICLGSGVYGVDENFVCFAYEIEDCHFNGFRSGVTLANRGQGKLPIFHCSFINCFIAVDQQGYSDSGQQVFSNCQFVSCHTYFSSVNYDSISTLGTNAKRACDITFDHCYFAGYFDTANPPVLSSTYDGTNLGPDDMIPMFIFDSCDDSKKGTKLTIINSKIESGVSIGQPVIYFNHVSDAKSNLTVKNTVVGVGYNHTVASNKGTGVFIIKGGIVDIDVNLAQFGDPDGLFSKVIEYKHSTYTGYEYTRGNFDIRIQDSAYTNILMNVPLMTMEQEYATGNFIPLPDSIDHRSLWYKTSFGSNTYQTMDIINNELSATYDSLTSNLILNTWEHNKFKYYLTLNANLAQPTRKFSCFEFSLRIVVDASIRTLTQDSIYIMPDGFSSTLQANKTYILNFKYNEDISKIYCTSYSVF